MLLLKNFLYSLPKTVNDIPFDEALAEIALNDKDWFVRLCAVYNDNLADQETLKQVALNDKKSDVRERAVTKLIDKETLQYIAINDESWYVRITAEDYLKKL